MITLPKESIPNPPVWYSIFVPPNNVEYSIFEQFELNLVKKISPFSVVFLKAFFVVGKFGEYLSDDLRKRAYAARWLDVEEAVDTAKKILEGPKRV